MKAPERVVIVGASIAGMTAVEALRGQGYQGAISLIGDEFHLPYDRPPLSKQILGGSWDPGRLTLPGARNIGSLDVDLRLGKRAVALDAGQRFVRLEDGERLDFDRLLIATGVVPRRLPAADGLAGVHVLRTMDDALSFRSKIRDGVRLVIIGAGFMGCEVAAVARQAGADVTIIDPLSVPLMRQVGQDVGSLVAQIHRDHGVMLRCGETVEGLLGEGHVAGVKLSDGDIVPADLVLVAIGSIPATEWLADSGLRIDNGVVCDAKCSAAPGIYAAGDVARWWDETANAYLRVEHRMNAAEQAIVAATNMLGGNTTFSPVPYFWSDQYDARIQAYGSLGADCLVNIVDGTPSDRRFIAEYVKNGRIAGVLSWNMPKEIRGRRSTVGKAVADASA